MRKRITSIVTIGAIFLSTSAIAAPADWKYYGGATFAKDDSVHVFYLASEVKRTAGEHVEVWTKGLSAKELKKARDALDKSVIDRVAAKIVHGYVPPIAKVMKLNQDQLIDIVTFEEIANDANIEPRMRILYEIDCAGQLIRELSMSLVTAGGRRGGRETAGQWAHNAPETNGTRLAALVCR